MDVFSSYTGLPSACRNCVLVIGNFDGVHRGHQTLLSRAQDIARAHDAPLGVLSFEPHPRRVFRPDDPPFRITPAPIKRERLASLGVDLLFEIPFDWTFASQSADLFTQNVLCTGIAPSRILVGEDFRFGQLRKGTPETLRAAGLTVETVPLVGLDPGFRNSFFSSTDIRTALRHGDIEKANAMLGWPWEIQGEVVKGDQRGRTIGFPTANMPLGETLHPAYGVYAGKVSIIGEEPEIWRPCATNIGIRPMFAVPTAQVESHILDFDQMIYGRTLRLRPVIRLRGEARFETLDALVTQMHEDCARCRDVLKPEKTDSGF